LTKSEIKVAIKALEIDKTQPFLVVMGAFFALFAVGIVINSFGVFFKSISSSFGWTRAEISLGASIAIVFSGITSLVAGRLADKFSPRLNAIICGAVGGLGCIILSQTSQLWQLYFGYGILVGIAMANVVPITSLISRRYEKRRGLFIGITLAGGGIGTIISAPIITKLIEIYDWRTSYLILGIAVLIIVAFSGLCLRDPAGNKAQETKINDSVKEYPNKSLSFTGSFKFGVFWIIMIAVLCATFVQQVIGIHIIPHITDLGFSPMQAAAVFSIVSIASSIGNFTSGKAVDVLGSRQTLIISFVIMFISLFILIFANMMWLFFAFAALFGIAFGSVTTLRFTLVAEIFGAETQGGITGAMFLLCNIGGAVSPLLAGYLFDISGKYQIGFIIIPAASLIGLAMAVWLRLKKSSGHLFQTGSLKNK
jgi:MFS family permease